MTSGPSDLAGPHTRAAIRWATRGRSRGCGGKQRKPRTLFAKFPQALAGGVVGAAGLGGKNYRGPSAKQAAAAAVCCRTRCRGGGSGRSSDDDGDQTAANLAKPQKGKTQRVLRATFSV